MRTTIYIAAVIILSLTGGILGAKAQTTTDNNLEAQPAWGPAGYPHAEYYYLPDLETYYSVQGHQFVYLSGGRWVYAAALPAQYSKYDLFSGYKVVLNSPRPYLNLTKDKIDYIKYKGLKNSQATIRDGKDTKHHNGGTDNKGPNDM